MAAPWCGQPLPDDRDGWRTRALAFREAAEEAEAERDAARREVERLVTAIGAALGAYDDWLHCRHEAASVARIIKPLTAALRVRPS
jgi:hypothetical protein